MRGMCLAWKGQLCGIMARGELFGDVISTDCMRLVYCIFFCIVIRLFLRTWADVKHVESDNDCSDMLRPRKGLSHPDRSVKVPKFKRFDKLTAAQQAAVRHGLDLDVATWDAWAVGECKSQLDSAPVGHAELVESRDVARSGLADWLLSH